VELARLAATVAPGAGGLRPTLAVTIDYDVLLGRLRAAGRIGVTEAISPESARRIGCDAGILPAVLGGAGQVLDIGRATRTIPPAMRRALAFRDEACAMPGCDRLASWCDGHHIRHWADGGDTALRNLVHHQSTHYRKSG